MSSEVSTSKRTMHYAEVDVAGPLAPVTLPAGTSALALFVRRARRPIGFLFKENVSQAVLAPDELSPWIARELGKKLLAETIRGQLTLSANPNPFPSVSVAICTRNRVTTLSRCLDSLRPLQQRHGFDLLVIDNAPPNDDTANLVRTLPGIRYAVEDRPGLNFARNRACMEATGELLAFLDDDVVVDEIWFDGLQEAWRENPDAGGFTGLVMPMKMDTPARILFELRSGFRRGFDKIRFGREYPSNPLYPCGAGIFGAGANMTFRRKLVLELGSFDEALDTGAPLPGGGDLDMFYRVVRSGAPLVYEPSLLVYHEHRATEPELRRQYYTWGLGFMAFVQKSLRSDPANRPRFRRLIRWWFGDQAKQLYKAIRGRHVLPPSMILAEMHGGATGLLGEYQRSLRRIATIRRQSA